MRSKIQDEFTNLHVSRQRKWQLRKVRDGLCFYCGQPKDPRSAAYCIKHMMLIREYQRLAVGSVKRYESCKSYQ